MNLKEHVADGNLILAREALIRNNLVEAGTEVERCQAELAQNGARGSLVACLMLYDLLMFLLYLQLDDAIILVVKTALNASRDTFVLRLQMVTVVGDPHAMHQAMVVALQGLNISQQRCQEELERLYNAYKKTVRPVLGALAFESRAVQERAARQARRRQARQAAAGRPAAGVGEAAPGPGPAESHRDVEEGPAEAHQATEGQEAPAIEVRNTFIHYRETEAQWACSGGAPRSRSAPPAPRGEA